MELSTEETISELRAARLRRGIPQSEIAERIGTTQSAIARLEAAQSDPRIGTIHRYAESVGMRLVAIPLVASPRLAQVAKEVGMSVARSDPDEALRHVIQFLNDVRRLEPPERRQAISEEPEAVGDRRWDALLAGIAEYVSQRSGIVVPGWTAAPARFLHRFWFVIEDVLGRPAPGLAALAFVRSPAELANRGVFIDGDSLVSV